MREAKERNDRLLLRMEILICIVSGVCMGALIILSVMLPMPEWLQYLLICAAIVQFIPCFLYAMRIEQIAGCYMCKSCGERWVPTYAQVFFAPHVNRSRKMTSPHCGRRCYHKKVLTKDE